MFKEIFAGVTLSILLLAPVQAQENRSAAGDGAPELQALNGGAVPVQPPYETEPKQVESKEQQAIEYKFGLAGLLRGEGAGSYRFSDYSYEPRHDDGRLLYRVKPYLVWNPTDYLGLTAEGQAYGFTGKGSDDWWLSLYLGYLDLKLPGSDLVSLRAGRQEFSYGSAFMLGPDAFYNGLSFDALRLRLQPAASLSVDFLGGRYVSPWSDGVTGNLVGAYASYVPSEGNAFEAYLLSDAGSSAHHKGEATDSVGLRAIAKLGPVALEVEPVYQFGETLNAQRGGNDEISAYGGHLDLSGEFKTGTLRHRPFIGYAIGSGSRAAAEGTTSRREFRNPDNDTTLVGDMNVIGDLSGANVAGRHASGLSIYTAGWTVDLTPALSLTAAGHYFRAGATEAGFSRELGVETDFCLSYAFSEDYSLLLAYDRFFTGRFFLDASGARDDVQYGYAMLQFNLEKSKPRTPKAAKGV